MKTKYSDVFKNVIHKDINRYNIIALITVTFTVYNLRSVS